MQAEENNKPATTVVEEGEKVSGGEEAGSQEDQEMNPEPAPTQNQESSPAHDTKKEDMTGYNEHPDQEKVGG
jgi:hypothetical protein